MMLDKRLISSTVRSGERINQNQLLIMNQFTIILVYVQSVKEMRLENNIKTSKVLLTDGSIRIGTFKGIQDGNIVFTQNETEKGNEALINKRLVVAAL